MTTLAGTLALTLSISLDPSEKNSMAEPVSIKRVAEEAGVSIKTVSRVINNRPDVSPETRQRIQEIIQRLDYQPNAFAQGLRARQTFTIAFVILHYQHRALLSEPYLSGIVSGIVDALTDEGYYLLTYPVPDTDEAIRGLRALLNSGRVDGLIIQQAYPNDQLCQIVADAGLPTAYIAIDAPPHENAFNVTTDFAAGTRLALQHLVDRGHTRIGHIHGDLSYAVAKERLDAFKDFLNEHNLPYRPEWVCGGGWSRTDGCEAAARILNQAERPTAIVAANDTIAIGAMEEIHRHGLRIPEDVAITGYDDIPLAADLAVPLTTIRTSFYRFGHSAAANLVKLIRDPSFCAGQVQVPFKLIERAST